MVEGKLQREGEVVHVIVKRCFDLTKMLNELNRPADDDTLVPNASTPALNYTTENKPTQRREQTTAEVFPQGRILSRG